MPIINRIADFHPEMTQWRHQIQPAPLRVQGGEPPSSERKPDEKGGARREGQAN
jgi:hypothetical protein